MSFYIYTTPNLVLSSANYHIGSAYPTWVDEKFEDNLIRIAINRGKIQKIDVGTATDEQVKYIFNHLREHANEDWQRRFKLLGLKEDTQGSGEPIKDVPVDIVASEPVQAAPKKIPVRRA